MTPEHKETILDVVAKMMKMLYEMDEEASLREVTFELESLLAGEYGISHDDIIAYVRTSGLGAAVEVICFVCGAEVPVSQAEKVALADGIRSYLCDSCNQIRLVGRSDTRRYEELSDEEKSLLKVVQEK